MRYITLGEMLELYVQILHQSGGAVGIHNLGALESALIQPRMTFGGEDLPHNCRKGLGSGLFNH